MGRLGLTRRRRWRSAADDKGIVSYSHIHLFSKVLHCSSSYWIPHAIIKCRMTILIMYFPCLRAAARFFPRDDCSIHPLALLFVYPGIQQKWNDWKKLEHNSNKKHGGDGKRLPLTLFPFLALFHSFHFCWVTGTRSLNLCVCFDLFLFYLRFSDRNELQHQVPVCNLVVFITAIPILL